MRILLPRQQFEWSLLVIHLHAVKEQPKTVYPILPMGVKVW